MLRRTCMRICIHVFLYKLPEGIIAQVGMILQVLGNLYGLPSSGRNFSKAVDAIVTALGYMSTPYDPKLFVKWMKGMPILVIFHTDDFRWCGPPAMIEEWNKLVAAKSKTGPRSHLLELM